MYNLNMQIAQRGRPLFRIGELFAQLRLEQRIRRDTLRLNEFSDSQLRDIGLNRLLKKDPKQRVSSS